MRHHLAIPLVLLAVPALAATPPAATPASPGLGGPVIAGVCLLSREAVFANAKVGVAATARLRELSAQVEAEIKTERDALDAELQAAARLAADQRRVKEDAIRPRVSALQLKVDQRMREIEATRAKAIERISAEAQPAITEVYRQRNCGLLLDRGTVLGGNFTNDLTAAAVNALDARITTITFNRETLPPPETR